MSPPRTDNTEVLIILFAKLLDNEWKEEYTFIDQENVSNTSLNPLHFLATSLHKANSTNSSDFVFVTQLDVKESETYERVISCFYV